jgi:hypothetical protein
VTPQEAATLVADYEGGAFIDLSTFCGERWVDRDTGELVDFSLEKLREARRVLALALVAGGAGGQVHRDHAAHQHQRSSKFEFGCGQLPHVPPAASTVEAPQLRPRAIRQRLDRWSKLLLHLVDRWEEHHKRTPTAAEVWSLATRLPLASYQVKYDPAREVLTTTKTKGKDETLGRKAFAQRFERLFAD